MRSIYIYKHVFQNYLSKGSSTFTNQIKFNSSQKNQVTLIRYKYKHNNFTMATSVPKFEILPSPIKSESDKKEYRVIKLENDLIACLVSDQTAITEQLDEALMSDSESDSSLTYSSGPESESGSGSDESMDTSQFGNEIDKSVQKMAAAALCVGVGSFSDPPEVPGMAHFLEHMVFMGSEKFPAENDFDSFIKKGGGSSNASTDTERTCFYFDCLEKHLAEALDKFSQFFISPLLKKGAMTREREAIDSEFQMSLPSDSSRKEQLLFSLAKPNSPVNSFSWGNLKTLKENISDEKLYEGVHQFRNRHYSAHRMTLAIQARLPLDSLQDLVLNCFSNVPNNKLRKDDFSAFAASVFDTPEFNKIYYIKPIKELIKVDLTWSLPSLLDKYRSKPMQYVSYLLGDEGKGSLLSYLKKRMWALSAQAGNEESGSEHNTMFALFNVSIKLTEEGLKHLPDVIEAVFSYLNLLKRVGPLRRIYDEIKLINDTSFRFATEETPADKVEDLCESMQLYPSEDYMAGSEIYYEFDPKGITMVIEQLVPSNLNVMVTTKNLPDGLQFNKVEKWFGTQFVEVDISQAIRTKWENVEPYSELDMPPLNLYLTNNFSILPETPKNPDYPQKLINTSACELWYRKDQKFKLPMALYYFHLISADCTNSARSYVLLDMFMNLLTFSLAEEAYPATIANIAHNLSTIERGIDVRVMGFNEKIPKLIELIAKYISNLGDYINEEMFKGVKETIQKHYYNRLLKPTGLAKDLRLKLLIHNYWTPVDRYAELLTLTYEDMKTFIQSYRESLYVKALVQGNVLPEVATNTVSKFIETLKFTPMSKEKYPIFVIAQVPLGERCLLVESFNKSDSNSITTNYYQVGPFSLQDSAMIDIMMLIIEEPLFDILRTKEQLGYHVYCTARDTYGILGFSIAVISQIDKFSTQHLDSRITEFLKYSQQILKDMKIENFEQIKEDIIKTKEISDVHLKEEVDRNWSEIVNDEYMFDRTKQEIETIRNITLEEVKIWWDKHNHFEGRENFRKISIQVMGHSLDNKKEASKSFEILAGNPVILKILNDKYKDKEPSDYIIKNIDNFREKLPMYPVRPIKLN